MTYTIDIVEDGNYVSLEYSADVTINTLQTSREEVILALTSNNWNRILVDATRADPRQSVMEDFQFTSEHKSRLPAGVRIALLVRPDQMSEFRFTENVAQNRGVNLMVFEDEVQAINWLRES